MAWATGRSPGVFDIGVGCSCAEISLLVSLLLCLVSLQGPTPSWAEMQARCRKPLLVTSIIKKQNAKKFHSHRLFFEGWLPLQKKLMRVDPEFLFCRRGWQRLLPFIILAMMTPHSVLLRLVAVTSGPSTAPACSTSSRRTCGSLRMPASLRAVLTSAL